VDVFDDTLLIVVGTLPVGYSDLVVDTERIAHGVLHGLFPVPRMLLVNLICRHILNLPVLTDHLHIVSKNLDNTTVGLVAVVKDKVADVVNF